MDEDRSVDDGSVDDGSVDDGSVDEGERIAPVADAPPPPRDGSLLFTVRDGFDREEAILLRLADGVVALRNYCPH